jgi:hypothetical protein
VQRTGDGRIRYLLAFQDAPWRDDDEILADSPHDVDDAIEIRHGDEASRGLWKVGDVWDAPDGEPDTLVLWKPAVHDA